MGSAGDYASLDDRTARNYSLDERTPSFGMGANGFPSVIKDDDEEGEFEEDYLDDDDADEE